MSNDDVTAVISCFNLGRYVGETVDSVRSQEGGPARVIVVDDGSTDDETPAALDVLERDGVTVVRQENRGVCHARNEGLERVSTPYAVVVDADDRLAPGALAAMRAPLDADSSLGFAYGAMRFFGTWHGVIRFPEYSGYRLLHRHTIGLSALMRRAVLEDTGGFDAEFENYEDWELWLNALAHGWRGRRVSAVTLEYRRHAGNSKQGEDRRRYRTTYAALRQKHAGLYSQAGRLAREDGVSLPQRGVYRWFWGARPIPARLETWLHRRLFAAAAPGARTGAMSLMASWRPP